MSPGESLDRRVGAALLSFHARVKDVGPSTWAHRSLVQLWGRRFGD